MEVRSGWNSEYARKKYDVILDEADLARILHKAGLPVDMMLSVDDAHTLLYATAEIKARATLSRFDPSLTDELKAEARGFAYERDAVLRRLKGEEKPASGG